MVAQEIQKLADQNQSVGSTTDSFREIDSKVTELLKFLQLQAIQDLDKATSALAARSEELTTILEGFIV